MKNVMFVCKKNSRRSQMAEGFAKSLGAGKIEVESSGLDSGYVDPLTIKAMSEIGIDITQQTSKPLNTFNPENFDVVISLCGCGVNLPEAWVMRETFEDWQLEDPEGQPLETYRRVRDEIKNRVSNLITNITS